MAKLTVNEHQRNTLPKTGLCVRCCEPADVLKHKKFGWCPPWVYLLLLVGVLPCLIVSLVLTKRMRLSVPFCQAHKNHWLWRQFVVVGGFLAILAVGVVGIVFLTSLTGQNADSLTGFVCFGVLVLLVSWLITAAIVQTTAIRPVQITDRAITLTNISEKFALAYNRSRKESPEDFDDEDEDRPRRPPPRRKAAGDGIQLGRDDVIDLPPDAIQEGP
jgi:hypothetical protein